jgi:hypothetical protein
MVSFPDFGPDSGCKNRRIIHNPSKACQEMIPPMNEPLTLNDRILRDISGVRASGLMTEWLARPGCVFAGRPGIADYYTIKISP